MRRAAVLLLLSASCDPQTDSGYRGEPLVTLRGYVSSSNGQTPLEAAMLWQRGPPPSTDDVDLATRAPVQAGFPATFTVHLYQPPPAAARRVLAPGEVAFARANAAAVPYGVAVAAGVFPPSPAGGTLGPGTADGGPGTGTGQDAGPGYGADAGTGHAVNYALDASHWVVYLAADVPPHSLMEWWLGAALPAGFYLMRVAGSCVTAAQLETCIVDLAQRGVTDRATATAFCLEPYKLSLAPPGEQLVLDLGSVAAPGGGCP